MLDRSASRTPQHLGHIPGPSLLYRVARALRRGAINASLHVQVAVLRWNAASTRQYLSECNPDGLIESLSVRHFEDAARADTERADAICARLAVHRRSAKRIHRAERFNVGPALGLIAVLAPWAFIGLIAAAAWTWTR